MDQLHLHVHDLPNYPVHWEALEEQLRLEKAKGKSDKVPCLWLVSFWSKLILKGCKRNGLWFVGSRSVILTGSQFHPKDWNSTKVASAASTITPTDIASIKSVPRRWSGIVIWFDETFKIYPFWNVKMVHSHYVKIHDTEPFKKLPPQGATCSQLSRKTPSWRRLKSWKPFGVRRLRWWKRFKMNQRFGPDPQLLHPVQLHPQHQQSPNHRSLMTRTNWLCHLPVQFHWGLLETSWRFLAWNPQHETPSKTFKRFDSFFPALIWSSVYTIEMSSCSCTTLQDDQVTVDDKGRLVSKGKVLSQAAIEQRLRRFCAVRKSGKTLCGPEVKEHFDDLSKREELIEMWKDVKLNKDNMQP